jgi:hypothetical protein
MFQKVIKANYRQTSVDLGPTHFFVIFLLFRLFEVFKSNVLESKFFFEFFTLKKLDCNKNEIENELDRGPLTEVLRHTYYEIISCTGINVIKK